MEMKDKKLVIGLPTNGILDWRFASSLTYLSLPAETKIIWNVKSMIDTARNNLVKEALKDSTYTHLCMIDDDMVFEPDFANRLLSHDVDIVGGLAFKRRPNYEPCVYRQNRETKQYIPILPKVFQEVDIVGTGGIMINLDVFRKIDFPYFFTDYDKDGTHWSVDFRFCQKAIQAGFKIFVDPEAKMGHIGDAEVVTQDTFLKTVEKISNENK